MAVGENQDAALEQIKEQLTTALVLALFDPNNETTIQTDTSKGLLATSARSLERRALERGHLSICHVRAVCVSARLLGDMRGSAKQDSAMVYRHMYVVTQPSFQVVDQLLEFLRKERK